MRNKLRKIKNVRLRLSATVDRFGKKNNYKGPPSETIMLSDIKDTTGELLADHVWFTVRQTIAEANLEIGDQIEFEARVKRYTKGKYPNFESDFKLNNPTKFVKIFAESAHL